ncbi:NlpC/P60 family peptidoglycan endopeptidase RipB [Mycobacterium sp. MMS18-G62]
MVIPLRPSILRCHRVLIVALTALALLLGFAAPSNADPGEWDPTLPKVLSAGAPGDPVAIANASFQVSRLALETTQNMGHQFLQSLGLAPSGPAAVPAGARVRGPQAIEYVIRRAGSQLGVPYSWGGGSLTGPSKGIDSGANTVGFDCSGLVRYAFAGVGVLLPRFSGDQYNAGRHVPPSQAKRGDLIFYGPGGGQHVTLYLGNGQMLEAYDTGTPIRVAPVRTEGMTPYVTRIIES